MYKLIIVDDEMIIRNGIRDYIDWNGMGFEVVETFEDGKEALEYLTVNEVDVVLTDIEMAEVSGLELVKTLRENLAEYISNPKVVIISGYKEFEYARKAIEYGVEYYLLKPIRTEEINQVFAKIKGELQDSYNKSISLYQEKKSFQQLLPEVHEQFWIKVLLGRAQTASYLEQRIHAYTIPVTITQPYALVDIKVKDIEEIMKKYHVDDSHPNLIQNIFGGNFEGIMCFPIFLNDRATKLIVTTKSTEDMESFYRNVTERLDAQIQIAEVLLHIEVTVKIEQVFENLLELSDYQYFVPNIVIPEEYLGLSEKDFQLVSEKHRELIDIVSKGEFDKLDIFVDKIFFEFRQIPMHEVQKLCIDLFSMLTIKLTKMGIDSWSRNINYQEIMQVSELQELKQKVKNHLHEAVRMIEEKQNYNSKKCIEDAMKYILLHYCEDISLEQVAGKVFLNPTYFSRIFKQYTGNTFTDYLVELRMERAKKLLKEGKYKVYEISQKVGYQSEKYFFRVFKQYTGCSPIEYCRGIIQ